MFHPVSLKYTGNKHFILFKYTSKTVISKYVYVQLIFYHVSEFCLSMSTLLPVIPNRETFIHNMYMFF